MTYALLECLVCFSFLRAYFRSLSMKGFSFHICSPYPLHTIRVSEQESLISNSEGILFFIVYALFPLNSSPKSYLSGFWIILQKTHSLVVFFKVLISNLTVFSFQGCAFGKSSFFAPNSSLIHLRHRTFIPGKTSWQNSLWWLTSIISLIVKSVLLKVHPATV